MRGPTPVSHPSVQVPVQAQSSQPQQACLDIPIEQLDRARLKQLLDDEEDDMEWLEQLARLIDQREFSRIGWDDVSEYIRFLVDQERDAAQIHAASALLWLLYLQFWPEKLEQDGDYWKNQAYRRRKPLRDAANHVKRHVATVMQEEYAHSVAMFGSIGVGMADRCPQVCPYTIEQLCDPKWIPTPIAIPKAQ